MGDAWDGRPQNPERYGRHWLAHHDGPPEPFMWEAPCWYFGSGEHAPAVVVSWGYRYLGPCLLPADVSARETAAAAAMREAVKTNAQKVAKDRADWLVDAVATATQDRRYLRGDEDQDRIAIDAILLNGEKAINVAIENAIAALPLPGGDALAEALREAEKRGIEKAAEAARKAWKPAHTYVSEIVDVERALDHAAERIIAAIRALLEDAR